MYSETNSAGRGVGVVAKANEVPEMLARLTDSTDKLYKNIEILTSRVESVSRQIPPDVNEASTKEVGPQTHVARLVFDNCVKIEHMNAWVDALINRIEL